MSASSKSLSNLCLMPRVREEGHYLREMCLFQLTYLSIHLSPSSFANLTLPLVSSSPNPQHLHFLILKVEDYEYTIQCTHFRHIAWWRFQSEHACLNATLTRGWNITSTPETSFPTPAITPLGNHSRLPEPQVGFVCFWPIGRWSSTMLLRFGLPPERNTGTLVALRDDSRSPEWECGKRESSGGKANTKVYTEIGPIILPRIVWRMGGQEAGIFIHRLLFPVDWGMPQGDTSCSSGLYLIWVALQCWGTFPWSLFGIILLWTLSCTCFLRAHVHVWTHFWWVELLGHRVCVYSTDTTTFPKWMYWFIFSLGINEIFSCFTYLSALILSALLHFSFFSDCVVLSHYVFPFW